MTKINTLFDGDIKIDTSNIMVIDVAELRFQLDERFPWIDVLIMDDTDTGYSFVEQIELEEKISMTEEEFRVFSINWYLKHTEFLTVVELEKIKLKEADESRKQKLENLKLYTNNELLNELQRRGILFKEPNNIEPLEPSNHLN